MSNWFKKISSKSVISNNSANPGFLSNIEKDTINNKNYREVLFTTKNSQLVLMTVAPGDEIGEEVHKLDQFIRFESGSGKVILGDFEQEVSDGDAIVVPEGVKHNVINTSKTEDLKLYAVILHLNTRKTLFTKLKRMKKKSILTGKQMLKVKLLFPKNI